jgi:hypothetical protein
VRVHITSQPTQRWAKLDDRRRRRSELIAHHCCVAYSTFLNLLTNPTSLSAKNTKGQPWKEPPQDWPLSKRKDLLVRETAPDFQVQISSRYCVRTGARFPRKGYEIACDGSTTPDRGNAATPLSGDTFPRSKSEEINSLGGWFRRHRLSVFNFTKGARVVVHLCLLQPDVAADSPARPRPTLCTLSDSR